MPVDMCFSAPECAKIACSSLQSLKLEDEVADVEDAIVKVGESEGAFKEINNLEIERDHRFPVRVTLQFYKSTANGVADEASMRTIAKQIESSRKFADNIGSLVVGGRTDRPTEHDTHPTPLIYVPAWWNTFWLTYGRTFNGLSEEVAKQVVFTQGGQTKWASSTMQGSQHEVLTKLRAHVGQLQPVAPLPVILPSWDVLGDSVEE